MSGFLGAAQPSIVHQLEDIRLRLDMPMGAIFAEVVSSTAPTLFTSEWWPRGALVGDCMDVGICLTAVRYAPYQPYGGAASRYGFVGVTRDQYGTAIGSVVVKLYRTSDDTLIGTTTSDPTGAFLLNTPYYPDAHYLVAHKSGSPDVDGVSVNTLIGT